MLLITQLIKAVGKRHFLNKFNQEGSPPVQSAMCKLNKIRRIQIIEKNSKHNKNVKIFEGQAQAKTFVSILSHRQQSRLVDLTALGEGTLGVLEVYRPTTMDM